MGVSLGIIGIRWRTGRPGLPGRTSDPGVRLPDAALGFTLGSLADFDFVDNEGPAGLPPGWP
jgi:hypothetical protein